MRKAIFGAGILALASSAVTATMLVPSAVAQSAQARFGLRLVIEPACQADTTQPLARSQSAARQIAVSFSGKASSQITSVDHYPMNSGQWLVIFADGQRLLVTKCTGEITPAPAAQ